MYIITISGRDRARNFLPRAIATRWLVVETPFLKGLLKVGDNVSVWCGNPVRSIS